MRIGLLCCTFLIVFLGCGKDGGENPVVPEKYDVFDIDGNGYHTVTIGTQVWMVENLRTTRLNDGTPILNARVSREWSGLSSPGYCWLHDNEGNKNVIGALYNWDAVKSGKLAPTGWHIPTAAEWDTLVGFAVRLAGGTSYAAIPLKNTTGWMKGCHKWGDGSNYCGFAARPGGNRSAEGQYEQSSLLPCGTDYYGRVLWIESNWAEWWSATADTVGAMAISMTSYDHSIWMGRKNASSGMSVRCVKD